MFNFDINCMTFNIHFLCATINQHGKLYLYKEKADYFIRMIKQQLIANSCPIFTTDKLKKLIEILKKQKNVKID